MNNIRNDAARAIKSVGSPLHFFALAAILLAAIIIVGLVWESALPPDVTVKIIYVAFVVLVILIALVAFLIVFVPKKLVFDQQTHLTVLRERLGDSELPTAYQPKKSSKVTATRTSANKEDAQ